MQHYAKLGCLLIDHGTEGIRKYFQNYILRGQTPQQFFTTNKTHIDNLHHGRKRLINKRQYDLIFPAYNQPPDLKEFDITLIFLLVRQFQVGKIRPNDPVWNDPAKAAGAPQDMQDIILLKFERNSLAHRESTDITPSEFEQKWTTISSAVIRLGVMSPAEIQQLKDKPIEPEREISYQMCILRGYKEEIEMLGMMQNMDVKLDHMYTKLDNLCKRLETLSYHYEVQQTLTVQQTSPHVETHHLQMHTEEQPERKPEQGILSDEQLTLLQNHLAERYNREMSCVPRIPWDDTDTMNIDDVFVDLSLIQEKKKGCDQKKDPLKSYRDIFKPEIRKKRIIIRGKAGCGKSTVAAKIAVDWARSKKQSGASGASGENSGSKYTSYLEDVSLLFLIKLRFLDKEQTLLESIKDQLIDPSEIPEEALFKYIHSKPERIIIILDGYDEYNHANPQNNISKLIKGEALPNVTVIVTSRPWKAHELSKHRPSDTHVEIDDMSLDEIRKFIQNHFTGRSPGYHRSVVQYVQKFHLSISPTPLLLLFICILWDEETAEQMPNSLTVLYQQLVTLISDRYVSRQENQETAECYLSEKTNIIGKIAFDGLLFGNLVFDETNSSIKDLGEQIFHTGIMSRLKLSSIRTKAHKSSFSFIHKTIQEYFAAKHLVESCKDRAHSEPIESFLGHVNSLEQFQDMANVIQFVCGLSPEVAGVIFSHLHSLTDKDADFKTAYFGVEWNLPDCNPLFIRFITEMLTNNHAVTHEHMQWLDHLFDFQIYGIYPQAAEKILQYAHQITNCELTSVWDASIHKLQHHTIFPSLKKLILSDIQYYKDGCLENQCVHPNPRILSGSSMKSLIYLEVYQSLESFLSLEPPFPSLKTLHVRFCSPPPHYLVDMFHLVSTKSMVNLLTLNLSSTVLTECETCMEFNKESQYVRTTRLEHGRDPFIVTRQSPEGYVVICNGPPNRHTILIDTLCDLALQLKHLPSLERLGLSRTDITPLGLKSLTNNLHHIPRLQHLEISGNDRHMGFCEIGMSTTMKKFFFKLRNFNMKFLDITGCHIGIYGDMAPAMKILSDNLKHWRELQILRISGNFFGDSVDHLIDSLTSTNLPCLKQVFVGFNSLNETVQRRLAERLTAMPDLKHDLYEAALSPNDIFPD